MRTAPWEESMARFARRSLLLAALWISPASVVAQTMQTPLRIIVPFLPGSGSDVVARLIGAELAPRIGQPVIIVNQAGGSGFIATQAVQNSAPDGNTLLLTTTNHVLLPATQKNLTFDVVEDFEPVLQICSGPLVIAANMDFPAKTIPELIALAKAKPGTINYATPGPGTVPHLAVELFGNMTGAKMVAIPYRGGPQAMNDVVSGAISFYLGTFASVLPFFEGKLAFPLAITSKDRPSFVKDIPTIAESGVPDYNVEYWYGFIAPLKTRPERIRQLQKEIATIVNEPKARDLLVLQGFDPKPSTSDAFKTYLREEVKRWAGVATAANIKAE
jgi:tripartite-type tricarboxylate transporter receptor subunit TctC